MAITTSVSGDQRTLTLTYTANNARVLALMTDAARWHYDLKQSFQVEGKTWAELTNAQKLNVLDQAVKTALLTWARSYYNYIALPAAQTTIDTDAQAAYDLGV